MTKQKNQEERIREIIFAAVHAIEDKGLSGFSMDAVISHTTLSKGSVYRFFKNKHELMIGVFKHIADAFQPTSMEEALAWRLPLKDTLLRLIFPTFREPQDLILRRIHMQLMPELPNHTPLFEEMRKTFDQILIQYHNIALAVIERDNLKIRPGFESTIEMAIRIGQSLFDGLVMNSLGGMTSDEVENRISAFIDIVLIAIIEPK
jgi:AcrR family transcriptional regulator